MPKATKKKKDKAADFSKAKLKLGKGKQLPSNQIDTSFKARSIALPNQSIAQTKDAAAPTTKRRLTLEDLFVHLKHYSASTRRDALLGLRELLDAHPDLVESSLTRLFGACVRIIGDEDASVRKALLSFFSWLLPLLPPDQLMPHTPLLLLFTTSAQTHIFPEIQLDAVRLLDVLLDVAPSAVIGDPHSHRVLQGYLSLLSAGTKFGEDGDDGPPKATSTASVVLSAASKHVVLRSLAKFLRLMLATNVQIDPSSSSIPTWYLSSSFASPEAFVAFDRLLRPSPAKTRIWKSEPAFDNDEDPFIAELTAYAYGETSWTLQDLSELDTEAKSADYETKIARTLHPVLLSAYLDVAPTAFAPGGTPSEHDLGIVGAIADIYQALYGAILQRPCPSKAVLENLQTLLGHMAAHFPSKQHDGLSLAFCALAALLALSPAGTRPKAKVHARRVADHVVRLLRGGSLTDVLSRPVTAQTYTALLPTVWALLNNEVEGPPVLEALLEHAQKVPATSGTTQLVIEFVARLVLLETEREYQGQWTLSKYADASQAEKWVLSLPKTLWELGSSNPHLSETILRLLLRLLQRRSPFITEKMAERFTPFFVVAHPTRGEILGPFSKLLDGALRRLALDTAATFLHFTSSTADQSIRLVRAVGTATTRSGYEEYWTVVACTSHLHVNAE